MQPFRVWYICTLKNMYHKGSNLLTLLLIHLLSSLFLYLQLKFTFKILNTCRAFEQFSTLIFTISIISLRQKPPMSRQTWYSCNYKMGKSYRVLFWILHNHFEQLHKKGWNNFILISDKVMNDEFWAKVIWVTQYKHWFYPCM